MPRKPGQHTAGGHQPRPPAGIFTRNLADSGWRHRHANLPGAATMIHRFARRLLAAGPAMADVTDLTGSSVARAAVPAVVVNGRVFQGDLHRSPLSSTAP